MYGPSVPPQRLDAFIGAFGCHTLQRSFHQIHATSAHVQVTPHLRLAVSRRVLGVLGLGGCRGRKEVRDVAAAGVGDNVAVEVRLPGRRI